jgi:two-component system OmpR family response regulator
VARVTAILRRTAGQKGKSAGPAEPDAGLVHGKLALDPSGWRAVWDGRDVPLTATEFNILRTLTAAPARVFTRDAIIDQLRGPGFAVTDRTIDSHIRNLRAKFNQLGAGDVIETRAGVGYRLGPCLGNGAGSST